MAEHGPTTMELVEVKAEDIMPERVSFYDSFLKANIALASRIGIDGTPGWVIGNRIIDGAVGSAALGDAIAEARRS